MGRFGVIDIPSGISGLSNRHRAVRQSAGRMPAEVHVLYFSDGPTRNVFAGNGGCIGRSTPPGRSWVQRSCSYRYTPGPLRSRPQSGQIETGLDATFALVRAICQVTTDIRVRLSSIEATEITRELIGVMREHADRVCPHLHVCLQSGSDYILHADCAADGPASTSSTAAT